MSECRSLGSNFRPSSQSRKISIGIIPDSLAKRSLRAIEGNSGAVPIEKRVSSVTRNIKEKNNGEAIIHPGGKQTKANEQFSSPWTATRSFHEKPPASEMIFPTNASSFLENSTTAKKRQLVQDVAANCSVQSFLNPSFNLQNGESCRKRLDGAACSGGGKHGGSQKAGEFTFSNEQEVCGLRKPQLEIKADKPENGKNETLKMKLWEILGTVSSPNKQQSNAQAVEVGDHNLNSGIAVDCVADRTVKTVQNSDTIEVDSESHGHAIKRPVTRALSLKQAQSIMHPEEAKTKSSRQQDQGFTFSFEGGMPRKQAGASTIRSGRSVPQRRVRGKDSSIKPKKKLLYDKVNADKLEQAAHRCDGPPPAEKASSFGNRLGSFHDGFGEDTQEKSESAINKPKKVDRDKSPANGNRQEAFNTSLENILGQQHYFSSSTFGVKTPVNAPSASSTPKTDQTEKSANSPATSGERNIKTPTFKHSQSAKNKRKKVDRDKSSENGDRQEVFVSTSLKDILGRQSDFQSPTFGIKTPIITPSAGSTPIINYMERGAYSPATSGEKVHTGHIPSSKHVKSSNPDSPASSSETEFPGDAGKFQDYPPANLTPRNEKSDAEQELYQSSSQEKGSESNDEASPVIRGYNCERGNILSPATVVEPEYPSRATKRPRSCRENREDDWPQESLEQNQDDDSTRVVKLFILAIERIRRKMNSATRKKSTEIMMSISEEIKSQLQNAESQIRADILKLASLSKTKRKSLEKRCQEQQEQMKLIHEKFKDQIDHHLQDCRSTVEELEAHQTDLKGMVKKQKAVHQKLLEQVDEIVETQLSNAEKRVAAVRESGRQKLMQLKQIIVGYLKDEHGLNL